MVNNYLSLKLLLIKLIIQFVKKIIVIKLQLKLIVIYDDKIYKINKINNLYINLNIKKVNEFVIILLNKYIDISTKNLSSDDVKYLEAIYKQKLYNTFTIKWKLVLIFWRTLAYFAKK